MDFSKKSIWWVVTAAVILFSLSNMAYIFDLEELGTDRKLILSLLTMIYFACHWLAVIWISMKLQEQYPDARQDWERLVKTYLLCAAIIISTTIAIGGIQNIFLEKSFFGTLNENISGFFQGMGIAILLVSLGEAFHQYQKNQRSEHEKAELTRVNLVAQYNNLKQQVNPHFLFNSLNSLSSLISIDPRRAETFVEEMSLVYRYLLHNSQDELVYVYQELNFLSSYIHLVQTRFGPGLSVRVEAPKMYHHYRIPPLSLQLLVENAVKHNEVSIENPLRIEIDITPEHRIRVWNNLQEKAITLPSEKVGLVNIMTKYRLLGQEEVVVLKTATEFMVSLPLIKSESHESIDC